MEPDLNNVMYEFLKENFASPEKFLSVALNSAFISWSVNDGKVFELEGIHLIPGLKDKVSLDCKKNKVLINQLIPKERHQIIQRKLDFFFSAQKRNLEKRYILEFAINDFDELTNVSSSIAVTIETDISSGIVTMNLTHFEAINNLNDKILIIREVISENNSKIVGVITLQEQLNILLKNNEYEILQLLSQGYQSEPIATLLNLSRHTVDDCRKELLNKFNAKNIYQLIAHAYQEGFI
jgi:DNA-binding CsgD family transcriptional regulator